MHNVLLLIQKEQERTNKPEEVMIMYQVFTIRRDTDRYCARCYKKNMTKEEALALQATKMASTTRICRYVVVADSKVEEFWSEVARISAPLIAKAKARAEREARRWKELDKMYVRGYKVTDVMAYVNR